MVTDEKTNTQPKVKWAAQREYRKDKEDVSRKLQKRMIGVVLVICILSAAYLWTVDASSETWMICFSAALFLILVLIVAAPRYWGPFLHIKRLRTTKKKNGIDEWEAMKVQAELEMAEKDIEKGADNI